MLATSPDVVLRDFTPVQQSFAEALIDGFSAPEKSIPPRFLYDAVGSALFERITTLEAYYPTRTEIGILEAYADAIAERLGPRVALLEFGAGSSRKAEVLLARMIEPAAYAPIDVSPSALRASAESVATGFPSLRVEAICADYAQAFPLPRLPGERRVGFFPGSTIGNLTPAEARGFLGDWRGRLGPRGAMLVGVDLRKARRRLEAAYDDAEGVTAAFTLNILARANRELGGDFDLEAFRHEARYDAQSGRLAIHLVSRRAQIAHAAGRAFAFLEGERIHVEDSWKYDVDGFRALARSAGYVPRDVWTDGASLFSVHLLDVAT